jgi:hypothetical protein
MTPEERRKKQREARRKYRASMTEEQREAEREYQREYHRKYRATMTEEQREKQREYARRRRANMTEEQREEGREAQRERSRKHYANKVEKGRAAWVTREKAKALSAYRKFWPHLTLKELEKRYSLHLLWRSQMCTTCSPGEPERSCIACLLHSANNKR